MIPAGLNLPRRSDTGTASEAKPEDNRWVTTAEPCSGDWTQRRRHPRYQLFGALRESLSVPMNAITFSIGVDLLKKKSRSGLTTRLRVVSSS
ncbi:MAG: hypothetical protein H6Q28_404 [Bacteroidetes bacterium]|nr:hypothetical protein [Bacteroidota bacterium]